jgi:hypothetical protein
MDNSFCLGWDNRFPVHAIMHNPASYSFDLILSSINILNNSSYRFVSNCCTESGNAVGYGSGDLLTGLPEHQYLSLFFPGGLIYCLL